MKISELTGTALDWAVAKCEERTIRQNPMGKESTPAFYIWEEVPSGRGGILIEKSVYMRIGNKYSPSTNWEQGGPIIEWEGIELFLPTWKAKTTSYSGKIVTCIGTTPLIAAMRCYVASILGNEIDIPKELQGE
jgi:hypothetical protein